MRIVEMTVYLFDYEFGYVIADGYLRLVLDNKCDFERKFFMDMYHCDFKHF